jgi:cytidylate kinase
MNNVLLQYMKNRFMPDHDHPGKTRTKTGPVVTISRDYGCPAKRLAGMLSSALNRVELENYSKNRWSWIGKEILDESAKELNLKPNMVKDIVNKEMGGVVDDIVLSLSHKYYPGDMKIRKTMGAVIRDFAEGGHVIIVGRGGVAITRHIPASLHIKIQAPLEWRVNDVSNRQMISLVEARKKIQTIDTQRQLMREFFEGKKLDDGIFDVIFNYMTVAEEEIISTIVHMMELKDLI